MNTTGPTLVVATAEGLFELGVERRRALAGHDVIAVHQGSTGLWAITDEHVLWHRTGGGWTEIAFTDQTVRCVLASSSGVFVGTGNAHLLRLIGQELELVESFEQAEGRGDWFTPWGGPPDVRSLAETSSGSLLANVHVGGILRSDDNGASWTQTIDITSDVHEVISGNGQLFAATAVGLASGDSDLEGWAFQDDGLHATYARAVTIAGTHLLMSVSDGPYGGHAAVYRRTVGRDEPFRRCEAGLPTWFEDNIDTGCLAGGGAAVALGTRDGSVFVSDDHGKHWVEVESGLPSIRWLRFAG